MIITDIADKIRKGECVLFLGAGVHAPAPPGSAWTYPASVAPPFGGDLSEILARDSGYLTDYPKGNDRDLQRVAMYYELKFGNGRKALIDKVLDEVTTGKQPSPVIRALAELNFPLIVTTNFDSFFEDSLPATKRAEIRIYEPEPKTESRRPDFRDITVNTRTPGVLKIHGDFGTPESLVLTDEDYITFVMRMRDAENIHPFPLSTKVAMQKQPILFIGYSLLDYNVRLFLKILRFRLDQAVIPPAYSVDPFPDQMVRAVWQDQRRWVWFVQDNVWSFVPALYKQVTGRDMRP